MSMLSEIRAVLTAQNIPSRHEAFAVGKAPAPPFAVYTIDNRGEVYADDSTFARMPRIHIELFEKVSDSTLEDALRAALEYEFGPIEQVGTWSQSEACHIEQSDFT